MSELPKTFDPAAIEARWYAHWESTGAFRPARPDAEPFTIVMPPPNVTGSLHIGHALDITLQDILVRHARLKGKDALWVAGTDHAGIATQMVVERELALSQQKRTDYSREDFIAKVWDWKAESGGAITGQLRRLGASCDWANERFTMDEGFSKAVLKVFVDLHRERLIYRDKRLVNWDPGLGTAISDLEVETKEVRGSFWHLRYPLEDGSGFINVATTRPETMLADMAVAVHPDDERYTALVGKKVRLPITGRLIPIITDEHADPALGSGAVKITPGHDFNDFEVGRRAGFKAGEMLNMLDAKAAVVQTSDGLIPADLLGLPGIEARKAVVQRLKNEGFLIPHVDKDGNEHDAEPRTIQTPMGDRSGAVIEPWLTDQWYVDAAKLAGPAIDAVRDGRINVVPKTWEKTWFQWLENIQPWCVSRQLWWGHQIPAWYGPSANENGVTTSFMEKNFVALDEPAMLRKAQEYYGRDVEIVIADSRSEAFTHQWGVGDNPKVAVLHRDADVLDTWFSSALWPFGTLGWPVEMPKAPVFALAQTDEETLGRLTTGYSMSPEAEAAAQKVLNPLLAKHYPSDVLVSGFDILFFWDARMAMQGLHFMKEVPWKTLYLHGLVRAADGSKMSKSKGNTVDPLGLIDKYGADALRFFMAAMESQGRDIKLDEKRLEGYRNFATKLWNASRFAQANGIGGGALPDTIVQPVNHWLIAEVQKTVAALDLALADLRFDEAANTVYHFVWDRFCDWYLELIKGQIDDETKAVAGWALDRILVMLHPFMPFVTEELWHALATRDGDLIHADWPVVDAKSVDTDAVAEVEKLVQLIVDVRAQRAALEINPGQLMAAVVAPEACAHASFLNRHNQTLGRMGRLRPANVSDDTGTELVGLERNTYAIAPIIALVGHQGFRLISGEIELVVALQDFDAAAQRVRLSKSVDLAEKEAASLAGRLNNPAFVEKAKPEAVEKARADHTEKSAEAERLRAALARLG